MAIMNVNKKMNKSQLVSAATDITCFKYGQTVPKVFSRSALALTLTLSLSHCASMSGTGVDATSDLPASGEEYKVPRSYLNLQQSQPHPTSQTGIQTDGLVNNESSALLGQSESGIDAIKNTEIQQLTSIPRNKVAVTRHGQPLFSDIESLTVTVDDMSIRSFLNYVFNQQLSLDYVIGNDVADIKISLNVANKISPQKLFDMTQQVLLQQGVGLRLSDGLYYVYATPKGSKSSMKMGFGRDVQTVPNSVGDILQIVPLKYGIRISVERTLNSLVEAKITPDFEQRALFIEGEREQVIRALELIQLLDVPSNRGKYISLISPTYMSVSELIEAITALLQAEGVDVPLNGQTGSLLFVPLVQLGAVSVFSGEKELLDRVEYWANKIDKPSKSTERQYYVYTPKFARASDLGESIAPLISGVSASGGKSNNIATGSKDEKESSVVANNPKATTTLTSSNENMTLVVDERSNSLIFHSSGREYQTILPLVRRMDILPKQVLLNVTIAEVKLTGEFKRGFEFALSSGKFSGSTKGAIGLKDVGGIGLSWSSGSNEIIANFIDKSSQVNILSKPSLLVRDGTNAIINVGDKIPVSAGSSSSGSGEVVTENISYRETGIKLSVTPTVNAQGVVIMEIDQQISNQLSGQVGIGDNPIFFERNLKTEVVADSGQTILLGGLISENGSTSSTGVPWLKSIPLLGSLFESEGKDSSKTELVILVTPKIIDRSSQWNGILNDYQRALSNVQFQQPLDKQPQ
jgi:general secretion pathway protein D